MKTTIKLNGLSHQSIYKLFPMVHTINSDGDTAIVDHEQPIVFPDDAAVDAVLLEQKWDLIREQRAPLLAEADILVNRAEDGQGDTVAARTYRQALRDVTKQPDPEKVKWPTKP